MEDLKNIIEILKKHIHERTYQEKDALKEFLLNNFQLFQLFEDVDNPLYLASYCAQNLHFKFVPKGNFLLHQGDHPTKFYFILSGQGFVYVQKDIDLVQYSIEKDENFTKRLQEIQQQLELYEKEQNMQKNGYFSVTHITDQKLLELNIEKRRIEMEQEVFIKESQQNEYLKSDPSKIDKYFKGNVSLYQKVYVQQPGEHFGEIGIFTKDTRSASIIAGEDMYLGYLTSDKFMNIFKDHFNQMNYPLQILRKLLKKTTKKKIIKLSYDFKPKKFNYGNIIYKEGEEPQFVYLIKHGEVEISQLRDNEDKEKEKEQKKQEQINQLKQDLQKSQNTVPQISYSINSNKKLPTLPTKSKNSKHKHLITVLNPGSFFGHEELFEKKKYKFTATALTKVDCYVLHKSVFNNLEKLEIQDILIKHANMQQEIRENLIQKTSNIKDKFNTMTDDVVIQQQQNKKNLKEYLDELITNFNEGDEEVKKIFGPTPVLENQKLEYSNIYDKMVDEQKKRFEDHKNQLERNKFKKINTQTIEQQIKAKKYIYQEAKKKQLEQLKHIRKAQENKIDNSDSTNTQVQILNDDTLQERHKDKLFISNDMTTFKQVRKRIEHQRSKPDQNAHKFIKDKSSLEMLFKNVNLSTKNKKGQQELKNSFERLINSKESPRKSLYTLVDQSLILEEDDPENENIQQDLDNDNSINDNTIFSTHNHLKFSSKNLDDSVQSMEKSKISIRNLKPQYNENINNNTDITKNPYKLDKGYLKTEQKQKNKQNDISQNSMSRSNIQLKQIPLFDDNNIIISHNKSQVQNKSQNNIIIKENQQIHSTKTERKNTQYNKHSIFELKQQQNNNNNIQDQSPLQLSSNKINNKLYNKNSIFNRNIKSHRSMINTSANHSQQSHYSPHQKSQFLPNKQVQVLKPISYNPSGNINIDIYSNNINNINNINNNNVQNSAQEYQLNNNKSSHASSHTNSQSNLFYYKNKLASPGKKKKSLLIQDHLLKQKSLFQKKLSLPSLAIKQNISQANLNSPKKNLSQIKQQSINKSHRILTQPQQSFRSAGNLDSLNLLF